MAVFGLLKFWFQSQLRLIVQKLNATVMIEICAALLLVIVQTSAYVTAQRNI
jgi:hypothetical protein